MSTLYNLEPQPTAKVVLHTTTGDILLELFAQQTPVTSRNFLQLCLDGYYDNTIFHRLVPDFIIQGGDPTGTGSGGESSHDGGRPFEDEFHTRLKFNRRGLLGMANSGDKNDNTSQFFLTLGKTEELNGRNTMFGRVEGNTIFNLVKMGEAELVDGQDSDRPMYPTKIIGTDILVNPFDDMVKRVRTAQSTEQQQAPTKKKPKKKAGKQMLSFGDEDNEDTANNDEPLKAQKFNTKLINSTEDSIPKPLRPVAPQNAAKPNPTAALPTVTAASPAVQPRPRRSSVSPSTSPEPETDRLTRTNAQIEELKKCLKRESHTAAPEPTRKKSALEAMMPEGATRGRKRKGGPDSREELRALKEFNAFKSRLEAAGPAVGQKEPSVSDSAAPRVSADGTVDEEEAVLCDLHFVPNCQSCAKWDDLDADADADGEASYESLIGHKLSFAKDRLGKDLEWKRQNERELVVIDPREREKEFREQKKKTRTKEPT